MRMLINWMSYEQYGHRIGEPNGRPSKTVPGMTLSIKELVKRYIRGEAVEVFEAQYDGDSDLPDITRMTEQDRLDLARKLKQDAKEAEAFLAYKNKPQKAEQDVPDSPPTEGKEV